MFHWSSPGMSVRQCIKIFQKCCMQQTHTQRNKTARSGKTGPTLGIFCSVIKSKRLDSDSDLDSRKNSNRNGGKNLAFDWGKILRKIILIYHFRRPLCRSFVRWVVRFISILHCIFPPPTRPSTSDGNLCISYMPCMLATITSAIRPGIASIMPPPRFRRFGGGSSITITITFIATADCCKLGAVLVIVVVLYFLCHIYYSSVLSVLCLRPYANAIFAANGVRALLSYATGVLDPLLAPLAPLDSVSMGFRRGLVSGLGFDLGQ